MNKSIAKIMTLLRASFITSPRRTARNAALGLILLVLCLGTKLLVPRDVSRFLTVVEIGVVFGVLVAFVGRPSQQLAIQMQRRVAQSGTRINLDARDLPLRRHYFFDNEEPELQCRTALFAAAMLFVISLIAYGPETGLRSAIVGALWGVGVATAVVWFDFSTLFPTGLGCVWTIVATTVILFLSAACSELPETSFLLVAALARLASGAIVFRKSPEEQDRWAVRLFPAGIV